MRANEEAETLLASLRVRNRERPRNPVDERATGRSGPLGAEQDVALRELLQQPRTGLRET